MIEKENRDLLLRLFPDIHRPKDAGTWLLPFNLTRRDLNALALASVTVLNREKIASQNHCYSLKRIAIPRHSLAGGKTQATNHRGSVLKEDFVCHGGIAFSER